LVLDQLMVNNELEWHWSVRSKQFQRLHLCLM